MSPKDDKQNISSSEKVSRTTLNLSVSVEDKKFLKIYAAEHNITVAAVIHECVTDYLMKKNSSKE